MFFGTTPQIVSQFIFQEIKRLKPKRIFVPFAGNFVIEQLAGLYDKTCEVHSTDVSLYSRAIGFGATDKPFKCKLKDSIIEIFPFFKDKTSPVEIAAQIIFFTEIARNLSKDGIPFYHSLNKYAKSNTELLYNKILEQFKKFKSCLPDKFNFYGYDAIELLPNTEPGDFVFFDPPVIKGDYEKMFSNLEKCFEFEPQSYIEFTDGIKYNELQKLNDKSCIVYYRTNNPLFDLSVIPNYFQCYNYQYKWHASYCLYSNYDSKSFVGRFDPLKDEETYYKIIDSEFEIKPDSKVSMLRVNGAISNHYRLLWVRKAEMSNGGIPFLIFIDDCLIGLLQIKDGMEYNSFWASIFFDPCAPYSKYKRLSKLILYLCCTETFLKLVNDLTLWEHIGFTTLVYTNEPVSMKYRSLFELEKRTKAEGFYQYKLIYHSKKLLKDYSEALNEWLKKDGLVYQ